MTSNRSSSKWRGLVSALPYLAVCASGVWTFASAFPELLEVRTRLGIALVVIAIIFAGGVVHWLQRGERKKTAANLQKIADLDSALPRQAMASLADVLFVPQAVWRLSIYVVGEDAAHGWSMRHVARRSAQQAYESPGRVTIPLERSILRNLWNVSLPHGEATNEAPDPVAASNDWHAWQLNVLRDPDAVRALRMKSRRYAWCAIREPSGDERTVTLVAETLEPDGIRVENVDSPLIYALLLMIARWNELRAEVESAALEGAKVIEDLRR